MIWSTIFLAIVLTYGITTALAAWAIEAALVRKWIKKTIMARLASIALAAVLLPTIWLLAAAGLNGVGSDGSYFWVKRWLLQVPFALCCGLLFSSAALFQRWRSQRTSLKNSDNPK
jgi:hypothetical protein